MAKRISPGEAGPVAHAAVDARELSEYSAASMKGSRFVPLATLEREAAKVDKQGSVLLVCRSGRRYRRKKAWGDWIREHQCS